MFNWFTGDGALVIGWAQMVLAAFARAVGYQSRSAWRSDFVLMARFERRNPVDLRRGWSGTFWSAKLPGLATAAHANSADDHESLRVLSKLSGAKQQDGTAVVLKASARLADYSCSFDLISGDLLIVNVVTRGTLILEVPSGSLVWNRR